jgi:pre-mRNA-splicing factor 38B
MKLLLDHVDSPYIRAIGFLYLRYAGDPKVVWKWMEPYLYDDEPLQVSASASKQKHETTMGDFVRGLFTDRNYHRTMLPRLPIQIEREIQVKLLQAEKTEERAKKHATNSKHMEYFKKLGSKVMALYGDDENPTQWYEGVVDRVITTNEETNEPLRKPKFIVTFPEYGNTETVILGELEMPGSATSGQKDDPPRRGGFSDRSYDDRGSGGGGTRQDDRGYGDRKRGYDDRGYDRKDDRGYGDRDQGRGNGNRSSDRGYNDRGGRDRDTGGRSDDRWERGNSGRGRSQPAAALPSENDLYEEVRRRERDTVTASGSNAVARRPPSTKTSLLSTNRDASRRYASPGRSPPPERAAPPPPVETDPPPRKRTGEELAAIQDKKRRLMAKYG